MSHHRDFRAFVRLGLLAVVLIGTVGCSKSPPPIVPAEGMVTIDGKPVPRATVIFLPLLKDFGAEYTSQAVTDENGRFQLTCALNLQPGAAACQHKVTVNDYVPDELVHQGMATDPTYLKYAATLTNRPIPREYNEIVSTPLTVEVKDGQKEYNLELSRK